MSQNLIKGFQRFHDAHYTSAGAQMPQLAAEGQNPEYVIISCVDSRSNPATVFDTPPGMFFAFNAMGAIVRPYEQGTALASLLQFAIEHKNVEKVIILGHTGCGAIEAMAESIDDPEITSFIAVARDGLEKAKTLTKTDDHEELLRRAEEQVVLLSVNNLKTYPSVAKALKENKLEVRGWIFDLHSGNLLQYDEYLQKFKPLTDNAHIEYTGGNACSCGH